MKQQHRNRQDAAGGKEIRLWAVNQQRHGNDGGGG
jgi:hypothetical protein